MRSTITIEEHVAILRKHVATEHKMHIEKFITLLTPLEVEVTGLTRKHRVKVITRANRGLLAWLRKQPTTISINDLYALACEKFPALKPRSVRYFYNLVVTYVNRGNLPGVTVDVPLSNITEFYISKKK